MLIQYRRTRLSSISPISPWGYWFGGHKKKKHTSSSWLIFTGEKHTPATTCLLQTPTDEQAGGGTLRRRRRALYLRRGRGGEWLRLPALPLYGHFRSGVTVSARRAALTVLIVRPSKLYMFKKSLVICRTDKENKGEKIEGGTFPRLWEKYIPTPWTILNEKSNDKNIDMAYWGVVPRSSDNDVVKSTFTRMVYLWGTFHFHNTTGLCN